MYQQPTTPLAIGGVVDDAIRLTRESLRHTWKLSLGFALVLGLILIPLNLNNPAAQFGGVMSPAQIREFATSPVFWLSYAIMMLGELAFYVVLFAALNAVARGMPLSSAAALSAGLRRLPGFVLASIVTGILIMVGFVLLVIPGIYLWGRLQLWPAAMFAEDATGMGSLDSSWKLTKGRWWRNVTIISVALILVYLLSLALGLIPISLLTVTGLRHGNMLAAQLASLPISVISRVLIMPAMIAIYVAVYQDSRLRAEGGDLSERAAALHKA